jgi:hypothetical protein
MGHILNLKSKYNLAINIDKELIFDGPDPERPWFSSTSIDVKLVDEENKEIPLEQQQKNEIIVILSKIESILVYKAG